MNDQQNNTLCSATIRTKHRRWALTGLLAMGTAGFTLLLGWSTVRAFQQPGSPVALSAIDTPAENRAERPGVPWATVQMQPRPLPVTEQQPESTSPSAPRYLEQHSVGAETEVETQPELEVSSENEAESAVTLVSLERPTADVQFDRSGQIIMVKGKPWTGEVYDGKPIRQARTVRMLTTAYSPDERSCGKWADGITASGMSVWTNGMKLVAADRSVPFGTLVSVPGYNGGRPVPVLDRGGAIKGNRLDLLYPTHEIALRWGAQRLDVVVWEYVKTD